MKEAVPLPYADLRCMFRLVQILHRLQRLPSYRQQVASSSPPVAHRDPGHESVMMGYDFHLTPSGPRLIEVNTNAGGALLAYRAYQPNFPDGPIPWHDRYLTTLLESFFQEMRLFSAGRLAQPRRVIILDDEPEKQFLAEEMRLLCTLFAARGVAANLADPSVLQMGENGVFFQGERVDLIYNRHCDFYLESPGLAGLRAAYLAGQVCLTPNPHTYALLADKRRMILWSDPLLLATLGLSERAMHWLRTLVPRTRLLAQVEMEPLWAERKRWVFKPVTAFGSRGVLLGDSISRQRFQALDPHNTLIQEFIPPSLLAESRMKMDWRLFVYQNRLLGVAPRLYQGQVTNFRTPGGGYAPVRLVRQSS
ncbi:MAG: hypothetical protein H7835_06815 [Magnetococcus sp. XQGC-1]